MLKFNVVLEKAAAKEYLKLKESPVDISQMMVMTAADGEKTAGVGALSLSRDGAVLEEILCDDDTIAYGMGKALLNALDLGGVRNVEIKREGMFELAKKLGFKENQDGIYVLDLEGYFYGGCH